MAATPEIGRNPVSTHQIQPEYEECKEQLGTERLNPSRGTKFSGVNGGREILIFPVELTTSTISNLTRLMDSLLYVLWSFIHVMTIHKMPPNAYRLVDLPRYRKPLLAHYYSRLYTRMKYPQPISAA